MGNILPRLAQHETHVRSAKYAWRVDHTRGSRCGGLYVRGVGPDSSCESPVPAPVPFWDGVPSRGGAPRPASAGPVPAPHGAARQESTTVMSRPYGLDLRDMTGTYFKTYLLNRTLCALFTHLRAPRVDRTSRARSRERRWRAALVSLIGCSVRSGLRWPVGLAGVRRGCLHHDNCAELRRTVSRTVARCGVVCSGVWRSGEWCRASL